MNMPCVFPLLGAQCYYHLSCSSSFYLRTWSTLSWHSTSLYWGSLPYRMFFSTTHSFPFSWQYLLRKFLWHLCSLSVQGNITTIYQTIFAKALEWWSHSLALSIFSLYVTCLRLYLSALLSWMNNAVSLNCGIRSYMIPHIWLSMMTFYGLYFCWVLQVWNCLYEVPTRYVIFFLAKFANSQ